MLCESRVINQNPKYRIIKYNNEYFMVDLVSTWIAYFLPMINWFIPKKYAKISREEFESLNIVKPAKNNTFWPVAGFAVLLTTLTRKYIYLLNIHLEKEIVILTCCMILLGVFALFIYINTKLKLHIFDKNKSNNEKIILIPTFKNICFTIFYYLFTGFMSYGAFYLLVFENVQNLILYVSWLFMTMLFMFMNMHSIIDKKVHIFLKSNK
ncbi:DUF443 domain-containing protein [Staphylococcus aureus]|uniref:DUF443 domain-containing protein n=1 Tax=Staphylococcus aureus TaxID=1280 RepID=UPI00066C472A|nr:DUF443 domain-containing protein [Staphylococcus aureus]